MSHYNMPHKYGKSICQGGGGGGEASLNQQDLVTLMVGFK